MQRRPCHAHRGAAAPLGRPRPLRSPTGQPPAPSRRIIPQDHPPATRPRQAPLWGGLARRGGLRSCSSPIPPKAAGVSCGGRAFSPSALLPLGTAVLAVCRGSPQPRFFGAAALRRRGRGRLRLRRLRSLVWRFAPPPCGGYCAAAAALLVERSRRSKIFCACWRRLAAEEAYFSVRFRATHSHQIVHNVRCSHHYSTKPFYFVEKPAGLNPCIFRAAAPWFFRICPSRVRFSTKSRLLLNNGIT